MIPVVTPHGKRMCISKAGFGAVPPPVADEQSMSTCPY